MSNFKSMDNVAEYIREDTPPLPTARTKTGTALRESTLVALGEFYPFERQGWHSNHFQCTSLYTLNASMHLAEVWQALR